MRAGADERAIGEAGLEPLFPDTAHRTVAVVDRMIGLNRRDDALFSEARQRVRLHVMEMLDAKAAVVRDGGDGDGGEGLDQAVICLVAARSRGDPQIRRVSAVPPTGDAGRSGGEGPSR